MISILHEELEHKVAKLKELKLEVLQPKNNKPYRISLVTVVIIYTVHHFIFAVKKKGTGGLHNFLRLKRGVGLVEMAGLT